MALTLPQALESFRMPIMAGIAKAVVTIDQMAAVLPIEAVPGQGMNIEREGILPTGGAFIDDTGVATEESTGVDDYTHVPFRRIVGHADVDNLANDMSDGAHGAKQLLKKIKATWRKVQLCNITGNHVTSHTLSPNTANPFSALSAFNYGPWLNPVRRAAGRIKYTNAGTLWQFQAPGDHAFGVAVPTAGNGTYILRSVNQSKWIQVTITVASATADGETSIYFASSTNEYEGMNEILAPSQLIDVVGGNGDAFDISMLDAMIDQEKVRTNRAFIMSGKLLNKYYAANRALGGVQPESIQLPGYSASKVPTYQGIPILVNDFIPDETIGSGTTQSLYLASLSADEGLFMGAASFGGEARIVDVDPRQRPVLGFRIENMSLEGKDHTRSRVKFVGALGLRSELALVRKRGVIRT